MPLTDLKQALIDPILDKGFTDMPKLTILDNITYTSMNVWGLIKPFVPLGL